MTKEQEEAIENLNKRLIIEKYTKNIGTPVYISDLTIALNLIKEQQAKIERVNNLNGHQSKEIKKAVDYTFELNAELEKKDKIIDLAVEKLSEEYKSYEPCVLDSNNCKGHDNCKECIKQYFEKKVEGKQC